MTRDARSNAEMLAWLFEHEKVRIRRGEVLDSVPPPLGGEGVWDRVEGMMLGLAIGDALGAPSEGKPPAVRRERHGEIRDYIPNRHLSPAPGGTVHGYPTDDTQLAFRTVERMIEDRGMVPERVAERFCRERIIGIGSSVREFVSNYQQGVIWYEAGPRSAGNGALMRIAPALIPHLRTPSRNLWVDTVLLAMMTHNDSASIASCTAFTAMLWDLAGMGSAPAASWWVERFVEIARELEMDADYEPRGGEFIGYRGTLWEFVNTVVPAALGKDLSAVEACESWYSGAYLIETVPCVLYILSRHGHDPEEALVRAVNDTKDNDTVAAIVGAAVGALHGRRGLPDRWVRNLKGWVSLHDDGRVFELLDQARAVFWRS